AQFSSPRKPYSHIPPAPAQGSKAADSQEAVQSGTLPRRSGASCAPPPHSFVRCPDRPPRWLPQHLPAPFAPRSTRCSSTRIQLLSYLIIFLILKLRSSSHFMKLLFILFMIIFRYD